MPAWLSIRVLGGILGAAALAWAAWTVLGWRADAARLEAARTQLAEEQRAFKAYRDTAQENARKAAEQRRADEQLLAKASADLAQLRGERDALQAAIARGPLVTVREVPRDPASTTCPDARRGERYRLCHNAAASGDPADRAACEAGGVPPAGDGR